MELDHICQNCGSFFQDMDDMNLGVCLNDEVFEPFIDEVLASGGFSNCKPTVPGTQGIKLFNILK